MSPEDQQLLRRLQKADRQALEEVYLAYQQDFLRLAQKYGLRQDDALDVFQDVVIDFYQQLQSGASAINSSIRAYLLGMGRYQCYKRLRQQQKEVPLDEEAALTIATEEAPGLTQRQEKLRKAFGLLSPSCQVVLRLFYYRGLSLSDIVEQTKYNNTDTVKSHKSRCLKRLAELIKQ